MKALWLKIVGSLVLVSVVVIVVKVFRPTETEPVTKLKSNERIQQVQEKSIGNFDIQPRLQLPNAKPAFDRRIPRLPETIAKEEVSAKAEKLYQMALFCKTDAESQDTSFDIMVECCRQILKEYPNSPQATKARELLQQHNVTEEVTGFPYAGQPKVKKSRTLRRRQRSATRHRRHYNIAEKEVSPSN